MRSKKPPELGNIENTVKARRVRNVEEPFSHNQLFDQVSGTFKPYEPGKKLALIDQFMIANAIVNLDAERIRELWTRLKIWPAADMSALVFWGTVHTIRLGLVNATEQQKRESEEWLRRNGFDIPKTKT
jgi:hypothetical protein